MSSFRLESNTTGAEISFTFDGKRLKGRAGDTLAAALLANGRQLVGRSFKYHRPRGVLTAGPAEPNALVTIGSGAFAEPNTRATMVELYEGLEARSQNCWPSVDFDIGSINGLLAPFLGAGFYYKTFMWPKAFWERVYEPLIRRAAGLGRANHLPDPRRYEKTWAHCDLLIVGAGPTGLAAALTAGRAGLRVILADERFELGGTMLNEREEPEDFDLGEVAAELSNLSNVRILMRTTVVAHYDDGVFGAVERVQKHLAHPDPNRPVERLWRIVTRHTILATGAEERPIVFAGNDLPGVMMAGAGRYYLDRRSIAPGKQTLIFTNGSSGYALASDMEARGLTVVAIVDPSPSTPWTGKAPVIDGVVASVSGGRRPTSASVRQTGSSETTDTFAVDSVAMSGGWSPIIHLACQRGLKPVWSEEFAAFTAPEQGGLTLAGSAAGLSSTSACMIDGAQKSARICADLGRAISPAFSGDTETSKAPRPLWHVAHPTGKAFVDFQNDVTTKDLLLAEQEGYGHIELAKRYTTNGMATDQGKLSNVNAIGILAEARGLSPDTIGTTTYRPFYTPVSFGALSGTHVGPHFAAVRRSPLHEWARKNGAEFVESGLWYRSSWFPRKGETTWRQSVDREVATVRASAGICDVSTLGKIEVSGRDAAEFLNRVYCNSFAKLPVGKARYGLMLREDGMIFDDGTTSRLTDDTYVMTTTTALAGPVMTHLEFCAQVHWPDLDVRLASVSDQWAQMAIAGPRSRDILSEIVDADISNEAFPYLSARDVSLFQGALKGRLFRISFSGELAFELAVPAGFAESVADAIMQIGARYDICAYGVEALNVLRIEAGHVTHAEINGTVTPADLGFAKMVSAVKPDFIGKAMLRREGLVSQNRPQLVGIKPVDPSHVFRSGAHILNKGAAATLENDQGYVTSSCYSPHLKTTIGLALVADGPNRHGEDVQIWNALKNEYCAGVLCSPAFITPDGRLHA